MAKGIKGIKGAGSLTSTLKGTRIKGLRVPGMPTTTPGESSPSDPTATPLSGLGLTFRQRSNIKRGFMRRQGNRNSSRGGSK